MNKLTYQELQNQLEEAQKQQALLAAYVNEQAALAEKSHEEWVNHGCVSVETARRSGMWYGYNDIRNRIAQSEALSTPSPSDWVRKRELDDISSLLERIRPVINERADQLELQQDLFKMQARLYSLTKEDYLPKNPEPTQDPATAIDYGLYPSTQRPVNLSKVMP